MMSLCQDLMTEGFSTNFEPDGVKLKSFMETVEQNIKLKGSMPHKHPEVIIDNEWWKEEEMNILNQIANVLFKDTEVDT